MHIKRTLDTQFFTTADQFIVLIYGLTVEHSQFIAWSLNMNIDENVQPPVDYEMATKYILAHKIGIYVVFTHVR